MINRTRMLLDDLDSEGFPIPYPREAAPLLALNLGRTADHQMVQALLADHKCLNCGPSLPWCEACYSYHGPLADCPPANPKGWDEVDGVRLPPITWAEEARDLVREADLRMDGVRLLSDSTAPDAYFGWK